MEFLRDNSFGQIGVQDDNIYSDEWGRIPRVKESNKEVGRNKRDHIKILLQNNGLRRPVFSTGAEWYRDRFNGILAT